jgi:16S rRNA (adenine1518-N6/adenine1519-N6)-dimethyltransferase
VVRLVLVPRLEKLGVDEGEFMRFLKLSFAQKRKTLWNNLKVRYTSQILTTAMKRAKIQPSIRAEALSLEQSAALFRELMSLEPIDPRSLRHA